MYKVMIVDDEQIVLESIRFILEKNFSDVVVTGTASSGMEAIELVDAIKPDIIFMDIKMPGINGLDTIKEIKTKFSNVYFIIVTAYDQFEYAKEALNLGVVDYLLKPLNREKVISTVRRVNRSIWDQRNKKKIELELKEKIGIIQPLIENGFIYSLLFFDGYDNQFEDYAKILEISESLGFMITIQVNPVQKSGEKADYLKESNCIDKNAYDYIRDKVKSRFKSIVGPYIFNRIVIFIPTSPKSDERAQRVEIVDITREIYSDLSKKIGPDFCIGIGNIYEGFGNLVYSYEESLKAAKHVGNKGVAHIRDIPLEENKALSFRQKVKYLLDKVAVGDCSASMSMFNFLFDLLCSEYHNSLQPIRTKLAELIVLLYNLAIESGSIDEVYTNNHDYLEEFFQIQEFSTLKKWCLDKVKNVSQLMGNIREKKLSGVVLKSMEYIYNNYSRDITLEEVSKEVSVSPHYFSKLFKEETGENFIDYLTSVRIDKAKELLKKEHSSIKEICFQVGYGDPNYFSRIFKKVVGITPTEYKDIS